MLLIIKCFIQFLNRNRNNNAKQFQKLNDQTTNLDAIVVM